MLDNNVPQRQNFSLYGEWHSSMSKKVLMNRSYHINSEQLRHCYEVCYCLPTRSLGVGTHAGDRPFMLGGYVPGKADFGRFRKPTRTCTTSIS